MKAEELTKREYIAAMAMQGTITGRWSCPDIETGVDANKIAEEAVQYADSLIKELNKREDTKSVDRAKQEMKDKAIETFRSFVDDYCRESGKTEISESAEHYIEVFKKKLEE